MTADDIIQYVVDKVQDDSFDEDFILGLINEGRELIAATVDLPLLRSSASLVTTAIASSVALPTNYHKGIYWVGSAGQGRRVGNRPGDYYNMLTFQEGFPITTGAIEAVCVEGVNLLYRNMAADTLTVKYYAKPTTITTGGTPPSELPGHLHRPLLVAYCCREIFSDIEDGMEGQKVNTLFWDKKFQQAMIELADFIKRNTPREPRYVREVE